MRFFYSILLSLLCIALTGCVQSMETLQSWYYFSQEKCPVSDCTYCRNADHYLLKIDTHTSRALKRESSSSGYYVRSLDHDARPICRDDCYYCNNIRSKYTQTGSEAKVEQNTENKLLSLSVEIESFTREALPEVCRERISLVNKYQKIESMLCEIRRMKTNINESTSIDLCEQQEDKLTKSAKLIEKKHKAINAEIEKIYVQYKIAQQNNSLDIINDISKRADELLQDLKTTQEEINAL